MEKVRFGIIGCGLMGREFASATARFVHLGGSLGFRPEITAVCDVNPEATGWFRKNIPSVTQATRDHGELLENRAVDAVYCAVPHDLHQQLYVDVLDAGKHLLGEKPFGIDLPANRAINAAADRHPGLLVRCVSELPFFPAAQAICRWAGEGRFGRIIEVEAGLWKSSDLDPMKPINWKRRARTNGEYGCMGDLGLHALHLPLRLGWHPVNVRALLSKIFTQRPSASAEGTMEPCDTWDNATLACEARGGGQEFPMLLSMKRIAPGHASTWFIRIMGTELSAEFSTADPKHIRFMPYKPGDRQAWRVEDCSFPPSYPSITPAAMEFGFSDSILQMWAAYVDELVNGKAMRQPFTCVTPGEAAESHRIFTAALESQKTGWTVELVLQEAPHGFPVDA
jgi:predicted dehydrogenase